MAVIGAGPGGIAMGIQLAEAGHDFTIFDRGDGFGGTWRNNTYPGAACDVPSHFYSFSFALNPRWSKTFAQQPEILAYLEKVAAEHGLAEPPRPRTRGSPNCVGPTTRQRWTSLPQTVRPDEFDAIVTAVGMLDVPNIPDIAGSGAFSGPHVSLVVLGSLHIDCGTTRCVDRHRRERDPVRTRGRRRARTPDGVPAHADLGQPPLRRTVHP